MANDDPVMNGLSTTSHEEKVVEDKEDNYCDDDLKQDEEKNHNESSGNATPSVASEVDMTPLTQVKQQDKRVETEHVAESSNSNDTERELLLMLPLKQNLPMTVRFKGSQVLSGNGKPRQAIKQSKEKLVAKK